MKLTSQQLTEMRERRQKETEWIKVCLEGYPAILHIANVGQGGFICKFCSCPEVGERDADTILQWRADVDALLAHVAEMETELAEVREINDELVALWHKENPEAMNYAD